MIERSAHGGPGGAPCPGPCPAGWPGGRGGRGDGMLRRIAVAASTSVATVSSLLDERRIDSAAWVLPSVGRWRRQFHAPSPNTTATSASLTSSVHPYGCVQSDESGLRCRHAV